MFYGPMSINCNALVPRIGKGSSPTGFPVVLGEVVPDVGQWEIQGSALEILVPAPASVPMEAALVNWLPCGVDISGGSKRCFLRLANLDNGAFERLGRYEAALGDRSCRRCFAPNGQAPINRCSAASWFWRASIPQGSLWLGCSGQCRNGPSKLCTVHCFPEKCFIP